MTFLFSARYALLTYAQCGNLDEWAVSDHMSALGAECIIGREDHADGGTHLHVFLDFGKKKQSRRPNFFDVGGHHPNITPSRGRPELGYDYAIKDGNVVAGGLARPGGGGLPEVADKWREIVSAESRDEFFDLLRQLDPKTLVTRWTELNKYADAAYAPIPEPYVGSDGKQFELGMVPELARWGEQLVANDPVEGTSQSPYAPLWVAGLSRRVYSLLGVFASVVLGSARSDLASPLGPLRECVQC